MTEKTIQEMARESAYKRAKADLDMRVLGMQKSAQDANCDPREIALIGSAYMPIVDYVFELMYKEGVDVNTVMAIINRFTSTLAIEFIAATVKMQELQGSRLSARQLVPFAQAVIDDHSGRIDVALDSMVTQARVNGSQVLADMPETDKPN